MQHANRNLIIALIIIGGFLVIHYLITQQLATTAPSARKAPPAKLPDFAAINNVKKRKQAFFEYLRPLIRAENQRLAELRDSLDNLEGDELAALAELYDIPPDSNDLVARLKKRVDQIPESLVLAQAAIESAWGTSRFARQGNNLFGQWCFTDGCGIVPQARATNASHEVRRFNSPAGSVRSYMHNLNSHRAYAKVRSQRAAQRSRNEPLSGCYLAEGLESYSEKGAKYVGMVKSMIRINKLEAQKAYCRRPVITKPQSKPESKPAGTAAKKTTQAAVTEPKPEAVRAAGPEQKADDTMQKPGKEPGKAPESSTQKAPTTTSRPPEGNAA